MTNDNKVTEIFKNILSGLVFVGALGIFWGWPLLVSLFQENIYSKFPHKLKQETAEQFEEAIKPISNWCSHTSYLYDGIINTTSRSLFYLEESNKSESIRKDKSFINCVTSTEGRELSHKLFLKEYEAHLSVISEALSNKNLNKLQRKHTDETGSSNLQELKLLTNHAITSEGEQLDYGTSLACNTTVMAIRSEAILPNNDKCREINWISFKSFKPIAQACYERCRVSGEFGDNKELLSLNVEHDFNLDEDIANYEKQRLSKLKAAINATKHNLQNATPKDETEWQRLTEVHKIEFPL